MNVPQPGGNECVKHPRLLVSIHAQKKWSVRTPVLELKKSLFFMLMPKLRLVCEKNMKYAELVDAEKNIGYIGVRYVMVCVFGNKRRGREAICFLRA